MINLVKGWGIPEQLQARNVGFVFNSDEILDKINTLKKQYVKDYYRYLHYSDRSVQFCLYDFDSNEILFTMDFNKSSEFIKSKYISLKIIYVNDPKLRNKGITTYYFKKLIEYVAEEKMSCIKLHANPNDKLFENKENTLSKKQLVDFYNKFSNKQVTIEMV